MSELKEKKCSGTTCSVLRFMIQVLQSVKEGVEKDTKICNSMLFSEG